MANFNKEIINDKTTVLVATFSLWTDDKRLPTNGSVEPLINFFTPIVKKLVLIDQVVPGSDFVIPRIEVYEKDSQVKILSTSWWLYLLYPFLKLVNTPGTRILFKLRDFLSVFDWYLKDRKTSYDFFIGLECINALAGIILRKLGFVKKVIYYVSDYSPQRYPNKWFNRLYVRLDRFCAIHADYIWDVSRAMQPARSTAGLDSAKSAPVIHVPNALFPSQIKYHPIEKIVPYTLVYAGSLGRENGPDIAIKALARVLPKFPKTKLKIVGGDKENITRLKKIVLSLNLKDEVKFYGVIIEPEEMSRIIRNFYIALAPYRAFPGSPRYWGDAGKIRAYAAAGLPIITTDVPPLGREVERQGAALIVKDEAEDFAQAIIKLFSDHQLYLKLRKAAVSFAKDNTWENTFVKAFKMMKDC